MKEKWKFLSEPEFWVTLVISILIAVFSTLYATNKYYENKVNILNQEIGSLEGSIQQLQADLIQYKNTQNILNQEIGSLEGSIQQLQADLIQYKNTQTRDIIGEKVTVIADGSSSGTVIGKSCVASEPGTVGCSNIVTVS